MAEVNVFARGNGGLTEIIAIHLLATEKTVTPTDTTEIETAQQQRLAIHSDGELGTAATDVDNETVLSIIRQAARHTPVNQFCLALAGDNLDIETELCGIAQQRADIAGCAKRFCSHCSDSTDGITINRRSEIGEAGTRTLTSPFGNLAGGGNAFTQLHLLAEAFNDTETVARTFSDQHVKTVGAKI
jgi:hypothetical protein